MDIVITIILWTALVYIYFLPSLIAFKRRHPRLRPISYINVLSGWTILGWFVALIWALRVKSIKDKPKILTCIKSVQIAKLDIKTRFIAYSTAIFLAITVLSSLFLEPKNQPSDQSVMGAIVCKDFVKNSLKSPSSAKFKWGERARHLGTQKYAYNSYVDSQNSFGAMVRSDFKCIVFYDEKKDDWELLQLNID